MKRLLTKDELTVTIRIMTVIGNEYPQKNVQRAVGC